MKKLLLVLILFPLLSFNSSKAEINITGTWKGLDETKEIGYMIFDNDGFATIEVEGQTYGGKEFEMNNKKASMTYSINFDTEPIQVDFVISLFDSKEERRMLLIAEFKDEDTMILASNFNSERPTEFNTDNSITLHRIK